MHFLSFLRFFIFYFFALASVCEHLCSDNLNSIGHWYPGLNCFFICLFLQFFRNPPISTSLWCGWFWNTACKRFGSKGTAVHSFYLDLIFVILVQSHLLWVMVRNPLYLTSIISIQPATYIALTFVYYFLSLWCSFHGHCVIVFYGKMLYLSQIQPCEKSDHTKCTGLPGTFWNFL